MEGEVKMRCSSEAVNNTQRSSGAWLALLVDRDLLVQNLVLLTGCLPVRWRYTCLGTEERDASGCNQCQVGLQVNIEKPR
ncbi:hypothetical protein GN956_G25340 [Arapaima gigas]